MLIIILLAALDPSRDPGSQPTRSEATSLPASSSAPVLVPTQRRDLFKPAVFVFLAGSGAAMVSVPLTLALGSAVGRLSSNLVGALLPSMLFLALIPPIAVTVAAWLVARHLDPDGTRFGPAIGVAIGLQVVAVLVAALSGVSSANPASVVAFTAVEAVVLPVGVSMTIALGWKKHQDNLPAPPPRAVGYDDQRRVFTTPVLSMEF